MVNFDEIPQTKQISKSSSSGEATPEMNRGTSGYDSMSDTRGTTMSWKKRLSYEHMAGEWSKEQEKARELNKLAGWSYSRAVLHGIFESALHSTMMGLIICLNAFLVIHQTDKKAEVGEDNMPDWIETSSLVFLSIYTVELLIRFYVYRLNFFASGWNIVDLLVVLIDMGAELLKLLAGANAPSVSILRICRLIRLLRLIAMISYFHELQTMLLGFGSAMKAMVWACFMIAVVLTVCSIMAVEFIHPLNVEVAKSGRYDDMECDRCARAFETVSESNLTFIQQIIAGDSWGKITIPIMEAYPVSGVFFITVFGIIDLGVLNLILTVIVNAAESARETNHEIQLRQKMMETNRMKEKLKKLCANLDSDNDGRISIEEFREGVDANPELRKTLALLDIQRQDAEIIYRLMDEDGSGDVDFHEFIHTMISTKHETVQTKLLFLKAYASEIKWNLEVLDKKTDINNVSIKDVVREAVESVWVRSARNTQDAFQSNKIIAEVQSLTRNFEQRWDQLQAEHAKLLESAISESKHHIPPQNTISVVQPRPSGKGGKPALPQVPLFSSLQGLHCTPCEVSKSGRTRIVYDSMPPEGQAQFVKGDTFRDTGTTRSIASGHENGTFRSISGAN